MSGWRRGCWSLVPASPTPTLACPGPLSRSAWTRKAIPFGLFLQKTPAAADQGHLIPDVNRKKGKGKRGNPTVVNCVRLESPLPDPLHNASSAGHLCGCWLWTRHRRRLGPGTWALPRPDRRPGGNERISGWRGGASVWGIGRGWVLEGKLQGWLPSTSRTRGKKIKAAVLRIQCPQGTSYAPYCSRLGWAQRPCSHPWWAGWPACWRPRPRTLGNGLPQSGSARRSWRGQGGPGAEGQTLPFSLSPLPWALVATSGRPFGRTSGGRGSGSAGRSCGRSWLACSGDWTVWSC